MPPKRERKQLIDAAQIFISYRLVYGFIRGYKCLLAHKQMYPGGIYYYISMAFANMLVHRSAAAPRPDRRHRPPLTERY